MTKNNILIFDEQGYFYGSTQKLLRQMAKILSKDFNVFFAGGPVSDSALAGDLVKSGVNIVEFNFKRKQLKEPHKLLGMMPGILRILKQYNIQCVYTTVYAHYQFPINTIPASIPLVLISPFGHFANNGNVPLVYVSGKENAERIKARGVSGVKLFFNPLEDFEEKYLQKKPIGEQLLFGRIGRSDDNIFDPIALKAFKKLEDKYTSKVKYIVVNPPPMWLALAEKLGVKNIEYRNAITETEGLGKFYNEIDVLAHARKDGETVGMAIGEAMLAGDPILTHKSHFHNDHFDILDASYSLWAEVDNVDQYFKNMEWMLEHKNEIRHMGKLARARALEIFGIENQSKKIIADFREACSKYYGNSTLGNVKGYLILYWNNLLAFPFFVGKQVTYLLPSLYKVLRKFYPN